MPRRKTLEEFKEEVKLLGKGEYEVLGTEYINNKTPIAFKHLKCNQIYEQRPDSFINGKRCRFCSNVMKKSTIEFKNNIKEIVGSEYVVLGEYVNSKVKIKMKHIKCGKEFSMKPNGFQQGQRCPHCRIQRMSETKTRPAEEFKSKLMELWGEDYELVSSYSNRRTEVKILHKECNTTFSTTPKKILSDRTNSPCSKCKSPVSSKGEAKIKKILKSNGVKYKEQYKFKDCKFKRHLPFDFYLPDYNTLIEYDGGQHFKIVKRFGGFDGFVDTKIRDTIKNIYCKENNIKLIRIPYWEFDNIENILKDELGL